jgi:hypothetical protein
MFSIYFLSNLNFRSTAQQGSALRLGAIISQDFSLLFHPIATAGDGSNQLTTYN